MIGNCILKSLILSIVKSLNIFQPWRCLWRGFLQITRTTFLRFTILQDSQSLFTDGRTFINSIVDLTKNPEAISGCHFWRKVIRPFDKS